ncbi:MAG: hypothetical protein U0326_06405 [Polyangiales bacterium]
MHAVVALLQQAAVLALVVGGIATIIQLTSLRAHAVRWAAGLFLISLTLPYIQHLAHDALRVVHGVVGHEESGVDVRARGVEGDEGVVQHVLVVVAALVGHVALAVFLLRRHLRGSEATRRAEAEREQVRRRERVRLPPQGEEL